MLPTMIRKVRGIEVDATNPTDVLRELAERAYPHYIIDEAKFQQLRDYCEAPVDSDNPLQA